MSENKNDTLDLENELKNVVDNAIGSKNVKPTVKSNDMDDILTIAKSAQTGISKAAKEELNDIIAGPEKQDEIKQTPANDAKNSPEKAKADNQKSSAEKKKTADKEPLKKEVDFVGEEKAIVDKYKPKAHTKNEKKAAIKRRIVTGVIICALALVGVVSLVSGVVKLGKFALDNSAEKEIYNQLLTPLVMYDPLPFETPDEADQDILLASSVWATIMNEDMTLYPTDEYGQTLLRAVDVEKYFAKVFGPNCQLEHHTFSDRDVEFVYDERTNAYIVPATNFPAGYTPQVEKIKTSFKERIVTVGYITQATSWTTQSTGEISKYVDYVFEKQDGIFYLVAVRESAMQPQTETK